MSFSSLTPDFRDSLREMADKLAAKEAAEKAKKEAAEAPLVTIKLAMEPEIEIIEAPADAPKEGALPQKDNNSVGGVSK